MRDILAAVFVCAGAAAAVAQPIDTSPDGIGIYFDEGAQQFCATATPGTQLAAYLCLTNASDTSDFLGWEASVQSSVSGTLAAFAIRGDGANASAAPDFVVSYGTPLPYLQSTVLMDITIDVLWEWSIALRVGPAAADSGGYNLPVYTTTAEPSVYKPLQYLWGWDAQHVPLWSASINDPDCPTGPRCRRPRRPGAGSSPCTARLRRAPGPRSRRTGPPPRPGAGSWGSRRRRWCTGPATPMAAAGTPAPASWARFARHRSMIQRSPRGVKNAAADGPSRARASARTSSPTS